MAFPERIPEETKLAALKRLGEGETPRAVAKAMDVSEPTVRKWLKQSKEKKVPAKEEAGPATPSMKPPAGSASTPKPEEKPNHLKAALRGAGEIGPGPAENSTASGLASSGAPITARGVLATCELVMNTGLTAYCGMKKIDRHKPEIKALLTFSKEEREMLEPMAEDAAPAWRAVFGQTGPGAVYLLLGAVGLTGFLRIMELNSKVPKVIPGRTNDAKPNRTEGPIPNSPGAEGPGFDLDPNSPRGPEPARSVIPRDGKFFVSGNPAGGKDLARIPSP